MKILTLLILLCFNYYSFSQINSNFSGIKHDGKHIPLIDNKPSKTKKNEYLKTKWTYGNLLGNDSSIFANVALRYDISNDRMELKSFVNPKIIKKIYLGNKIFIHSKYRYEDLIASGYFEVLNEGKVLLLIRRKIKQIAGVVGAYGSEAKQVVEKYYYLKVYDKPAVQIKLNEKEILKNFPQEKQEQITEFIKKEGLKLKREKDIIELFSNNTLF